MRYRTLQIGNLNRRNCCHFAEFVPQLWSRIRKHSSLKLGRIRNKRYKKILLKRSLLIRQKYGTLETIQTALRKIVFFSSNLVLFLLPGGGGGSTELGLAGVGVAVVLGLAGVCVAVKLALADRLYNDDWALASPPHGAQQL
jgi:hypothetical protein